MQNLQQKKCIVLGLTARFPEDSPNTHPQLDRYGIHFDKRYPDQDIILKD